MKVLVKIFAVHVDLYVVHVDLDVLRPLPLKYIFAELQSALVVKSDDDRMVELNSQLNEKML